MATCSPKTRPCCRCAKSSVSGPRIWAGDAARRARSKESGLVDLVDGDDGQRARAAEPFPTQIHVPARNICITNGTDAVTLPRSVYPGAATVVCHWRFALSWQGHPLPALSGAVGATKGTSKASEPTTGTLWRVVAGPASECQRRHSPPTRMPTDNGPSRLVVGVFP
jgi:hypothetical protein